MGNRLAVSVPSLILPIEFYIKDLPDVHVKMSLGNTCFLKVARCTSAEGSVVVKVFVLNAESVVRLEPYCNLLHRVHSLLDNAAPNCLMYAAVKVTDTAGFLLRQHVDSSLYERISTRPFLTHLEKTWLAFQLLCALRQAHQAQVYHGDIKSENVLVTRCGWLQLTDFAPFKPVTLPDNNPSDFTYFFDTSRRRTCYIAPERFLRCDSEGRECSPESATSASTADSASAVSERESSPAQQAPHTTLTAAMDIFSAGCVLVELFTEGYVPFDLTQLLAYRKDQYTPQKLIDKIQDPHIQSLVFGMLSRDPSGRRSAGQYMEEQRGLAFPDYFYSFLWPYVRQFAGHPKRAPDYTVKTLSENLNSEILLHLGGEKIAEMDRQYCEPHFLVSPCSAGGGGVVNQQCNHADELWGDPGEVVADGDKCEALILVLPIIASAFRSCSLCSSRLLCLQCLMRVARYCPDHLLLDRVLPYMLWGVECPESSVRACAVRCVTRCLTLVTALPRQDANIFPEYIVPALAKLTSDPCVIVRQALAENVGTIADTSQRYLEWSLQHGYFSPREYDVELSALHGALQHVVTLLVMDPSNAVKRTFMRHTHGHLWTFFGLAKANDLIMTHLITYLNDMQDHQLRRDFFECLRNNAAMIGPYQGSIILPLLMQGMNDSEEWVVVSSIGALVAMTREDIFGIAQLFEVLEATAPLLLHPNTIVRQSIVHLVCGVCALLDPIDVLACVRPMLSPYLREGYYAVDYTDELCLLSGLCPAVRRSVWRSLLLFHDLGALLQRLRAATGQTRCNVVRYLENTLPGSDPHDDKCVRHLLAMGLDSVLCHQLLRLEQHLLGTHSHRRATLPHTSGVAGGDGGSLDERGEIQLSNIHVAGGPPPVFKHVFSNPSNAPPSVDGDGLFSSASLDKSGAPMVNAVESESEYAVRQVIANRYRQHMSKTARSRKTRLGACVAATAVGGAGVGSSSSSPLPDWQPEGVLVSHLHEHTGRIHRLVAVEGTPLFASASHDGTVRLWDANRTKRENPINRSKGVYCRLEAPVRSLAACYSQQSVAASASNGSIHVFRLDKLRMQCDRTLDKNEDVYAVDMAFYDTGCGESVVVYGTVTGGVVGWDLRQPGTAWRFNNGPRNGLITSLMMDRDSNFLGVATNKGYITCWDIRFQLPIIKIKHENGNHIRRLIRNPCDSRTAFAAATGNNEVGLWELDTSYRRQTLWASPKDPLKHSEPSSKNINGLYVGQSGSDGGTTDVFVVTGGSDCCLRYWNLRQPACSRVLAHAAVDHPNYPETAFREVKVTATGNTVIVEDRLPNQRSKDATTPFSMPANNPADLYDPHRPGSGHRDTITDIIAVEQPQRLLVSCDAMGVIKMWK